MFLSHEKHTEGSRPCNAKEYLSWFVMLDKARRQLPRVTRKYFLEHWKNVLFLSKNKVKISGEKRDHRKIGNVDKHFYRMVLTGNDLSALLGL